MSSGTGIYLKKKKKESHHSDQLIRRQYLKTTDNINLPQIVYKSRLKVMRADSKNPQIKVSCQVILVHVSILSPTDIKENAVVDSLSFPVLISLWRTCLFGGWRNQGNSTAVGNRRSEDLVPQRPDKKKRQLLKWSR